MLIQNKREKINNVHVIALNVFHSINHLYVLYNIKPQNIGIKWKLIK